MTDAGHSMAGNAFYIQYCVDARRHRSPKAIRLHSDIAGSKPTANTRSRCETEHALVG